MNTKLIVAFAFSLLAGTAHTKDLTVGMSNIGLSYAYGSALNQGVVDAGAAAGVKIISLDARTDVSKQANDIDDLVSQKVDGIIAIPGDSAIAESWANRIDAAGIPFISVSGQVGNPATRKLEDIYPSILAFVAHNDITSGSLAAEIALPFLPKDRPAKIVVIEGAPGYDNVVKRSAGFERKLTEAGIKYEIVASQPGDWVVEKGEEACQNILPAQPEIDVIFAQSDDMAVGCSRATRGAGREIPIVSIDGNNLGLAAVAAGQVAGTVCNRPYDMGKKAFETMHAFLTGEKKEKAQLVILDTPIIRKENVGDCAGH
ncbi:hypothetical protein ASC96_26630 [Rhizobium sp. Root1204]|nr:hypothetical protein ASC96_26630 [Rhizobium sp. Root1204]